MSPQSRAKPRSSPAPPNQPEGPPGGTPYTVYFPDGDSLQAADLAYPAPLPRIGDVVQYIDATLATHRYVVREVIHTFQAEPHRRGTASARKTSKPAAEIASASQEMELRAGLPEVFLERVEMKRPSRARGRGAKSR